MNWKELKNKIDIAYLIFIILGFIAIAYFINIRTVLFLTTFFAVAISIIYFLMNIYLFIINKGQRKYIKFISISIFFVMVTGYLLFVYYGSYSLLRALSLALVVFIVILGYVLYTRKNS